MKKIIKLSLLLGVITFSCPKLTVTKDPTLQEGKMGQGHRDFTKPASKQIMPIKIDDSKKIHHDSEKLESVVYGVILAGDIGKRLWPLSREKKPKQFIKFSKSKTLLEITRDRIEKLTSPKCLWTVTTQAQKELVHAYGGSSVDNIIVEPLSRNTGPAILFTALKVYEEDPEAVLFFVPADHHIPDKELFVHTMKKAIKYASISDDIVLLGIQPRYAASEYGYIEYGALKDDDTVYTVTRFHEKPSIEIAQKYLHAGDMLWNSGIFCAKASVFIGQAKQYAAGLLKMVKKCAEGKIDYSKLPDIPFDKAILEHTANCSVVPAHFHWSDVGSLDQFLSISQHLKKSSMQTVSIGTAEHLIDGPSKLVATDIEGPLCVVETEDVIFITYRKNADSGKKIIEQLNCPQLEKYK